MINAARNTADFYFQRLKNCISLRNPTALGNADRYAKIMIEIASLVDMDYLNLVSEEINALLDPGIESPGTLNAYP